jgi:hypothetical protein
MCVAVCGQTTLSAMAKKNVTNNSRSKKTESDAKCSSRLKIETEEERITRCTREAAIILAATQSTCCAACGKAQAQYHCKKCGVICYCSATCQHAHWSAHRRACAVIAIMFEGELTAAERCAYLRTPDATETLSLVETAKNLERQIERDRQVSGHSRWSADRACDWCSAIPVATSKKCAGCELVYYCDAECQRISWPMHREECRAARKIATLLRMRSECRCEYCIAQT